MARQIPTVTREAKRERRANGAKVVDRFANHRRARDTLTEVLAVPTDFVQIDHATRVKGMPTRRVVSVHGPSNEGKTIYVLGLAKAFLRRGHIVKIDDAERTTTDSKPWVRALLEEHADSDNFLLDSPDTYEQAIHGARDYLNNVAAGIKSGDLPPDTCCLYVVDSMKKLMPKAFLDESLKLKQALGDVKARTRLAQVQANVNAGWLNELVPLAARANALVLLIAREFQDPDADQAAKDAGRDYKVGGGTAIFYDASLVMRIERAGWVQQKREVDGKRVVDVFGERHMVTIRKTKVGGKDGRDTRAFFHTSNGKLVPEGFDKARDVLELAIRFGIVKVGGSSYGHGKKRIAVGEHNAVKKLTADPEWLAVIEREVRAKFGDVAPVEAATAAPPHDPVTGEVLE